MEKEMKRLFVFGLFGLILISFFATLVTAPDAQDVGQTLGEGTKGLATGIRAFFETLFGDNLFGDKEMLSRVFFAVLLGMIVYTVVSSFFADSKPWIKWGITIAITGLAIIALPSNFLEAVRTSYGAMGAGILAVIPFLIILVFSMKVSNALVARLVWIFFAFYYLALYGAEVFNSGNWTNGTGLLYLAAFGLGIVIFFFIKGIRNILFHGKLDALKERGGRDIEYRKTGRELERMETKARTDVE